MAGVSRVAVEFAAEVEGEFRVGELVVCDEVFHEGCGAASGTAGEGHAEEAVVGLGAGGEDGGGCDGEEVLGFVGDTGDGDGVLVFVTSRVATAVDVGGGAFEFGAGVGVFGRAGAAE